jgi:hypothetical protein
VLLHNNFITLDQQEIKNLETLSFKYIWDNKTETIKREILYSDYKNGGLNMICIRAKINMIIIRNLLYIKLNMNRPQYQFSIYWMKFLFKEYLNNFNILPVGLETERPLLYKMMIEISKIFSEKYVNWCEIENVKRNKLHEIKMKKASDKNQIKPFVPYSKFLNNSGILCSKLIYNFFLSRLQLG